MLKEKITKNKHNKRSAIISIMLAVALVVVGAFAFMTATDTKDNVFTIGKVKIELHEDDWYDDDGEVINDGNDNGIPDFAENLMPGDEVDKAPYVANTGSSPAWIYMSVSVPAYRVSDFGDFYDEEDEQHVLVTAYAVQRGYYEKDGLEDVWNEYTNNGETYETLFGPAATLIDNTDPSNPTSITIGQIFDLIGISGDWTAVDSYVSEVGGKYFENIIYGYEPGLLSAADITAPLFSQIRLNENVGTAAEHAVIFMENDTVVARIPYVVGSDLITALDFAGDFDYWMADNGAVMAPGDAVRVSDLMSPNLSTVSGNIVNIVNEDPVVCAYSLPGTGSSIPKLMPLDNSSPAIIERDGNVETWVNTTLPRRATGISNPTNTRINPINGFDHYYVYNLGTSVGEISTEEAMKDYLETLLRVDGSGEMVYERNAFGVELGTGATISVYDNNHNLVEKFTIICFGDLNGDSLVTSTDTSVAEALLCAQETGQDNFNKNLVYKACDFNNTNSFETSDIQVIKDECRLVDAINHITGYNMSVATYFQYIVNSSGGTWNTETAGATAIINDHYYGTANSTMTNISSSVGGFVSRDGYSYAGLSSTPNGSVMTGSAIIDYITGDPDINTHNLYVVWNKLYTVNWNVITHNADGTTSSNTIATESHTVGDSITARAIPSASGYDYATEWSSNPTVMPASDIEINVERWPVNEVRYYAQDFCVGNSEDDIASILWATGTTSLKKRDKIINTVNGNIPLPTDTISSVPEGLKLLGWHIVDESKDLTLLTVDGEPVYDVNVMTLTGGDVDIAAVYTGNTITGWQYVSGPIQYNSNLIYHEEYDSILTYGSDQVTLVPVFAEN